MDDADGDVNADVKVEVDECCRYSMSIIKILLGGFWVVLWALCIRNVGNLRLHLDETSSED